MALTSVNFSNPFSCPFERSQFTFLANLLFPSIIIATCLGIGPDLMTLLQNDLRYEVFLSSLNQDMLPVPFFTRRKRTAKGTKKSHRPAGHECWKLNMCACALSALWLCMMSWQKKKVERCLPPCHALTVVGESTEHFLELRLRYDRFGNRNVVFTHVLIQNDEQRGR